ncbi:MAG: hypothetical protein P8X68_10945 [Desulfobacterales bacterium]|jgi:hypothetical protein
MIAGGVKKTKHLGTDRRWTLLFIGDHGNVIALKRFKAIVTAAASIFFIAICAVAILFFINRGTGAKNKELQIFLEKSKNQIENLRHEKEVLMARLVVAESKAKKSDAEDRQGQGETKTVDQIAPKPSAPIKEPAQKVDQKIAPEPKTSQPKPVAVEKDKPEPVLSVAVEDFSVSYEPDSKNLNAQFKIKNTGPESQPVSGRTVVVLKGDDLPINQWLVMPAVAMVGDVPSGKRGKAFSIRRFRTMNFNFKSPDYFDEFQTAVVYVFLRSGELLLEEDFPVTLPPPPAPAIKAPAAQTPSTENLPAKEKTPSAESPSSENLPANAPSAETPSADDSTGPVGF